MSRFHPIIACCALVFGTPVFAESYDVDSNTGFRMDKYRAPVPDSIPDGTTVDTAFVREQHDKGNMIFVDVLPPKGMGADPIDGFWLITEPRLSISSTIWLPEVGRGHLEPEHEDYFKRNLARLSGNDKAAELLFFCTSDCWQSWNAAKRAISWGYQNVFWYPNGTDGWEENGYPLVEIPPVNFVNDTTPILFPSTAHIYLSEASGAETNIGSVNFKNQPDGSATFEIDVSGNAFTDQFLSMRPFNCITGDEDWYCYLSYPYDIRNTVTVNDFTNLEYNLLFITKSAKEFGIDAWNGVYYTIDIDESGVLTGALLQGDLNVLQSPPEPYAHPINLNEFTGDEAAKQRFPTLSIRP